MALEIAGMGRSRPAAPSSLRAPAAVPPGAAAVARAQAVFAEIAPPAASSAPNPLTGEGREAVLRKKVLTQVGAVIQEIGRQGQHWETVPAQLEEERLALLLRGPSRLSLGRLLAIRNGWWSWSKWVISHPQTPKLQPTGMQLGSTFNKSLSEARL